MPELVNSVGGSVKCAWRRSRTLAQRTCLFGLLSCVSAAVLAQVDYGAAFRATPMWPKDGIIPEEWEERYVFPNLEAGQLVLAYPPDLESQEFGLVTAPSASRVIERFNLTNQVDASLSIDIERRRSGFTYSYRISNSARARDAINLISIVAPGAESDHALYAPKHWRAFAGSSEVEAVWLAIGRPNGVFLDWYPFDPELEVSSAAAIRPGYGLDGFRVTSGQLNGRFPQFAHRHAGRLQTSTGLNLRAFERARHGGHYFSAGAH